MSPVMGLGSGKSGTPCERMQRDTPRSFCISRGLTTCVVGAVGRWPPLYFAQARDAAPKVGEEKTPELLKAPIALSGEPGSGKFKTPCERIHLAYLRGSPLEDCSPLAAAPTGTAVVVVPVVVVPILATPDLAAPPHPAVARAMPMTAGATSASRRRLPSPWGCGCARFIGGQYERTYNTGITPSRVRGRLSWPRRWARHRIQRHPPARIWSSLMTANDTGARFVERSHRATPGSGYHLATASPAYMTRPFDPDTPPAAAIGSAPWVARQEAQHGRWDLSLLF
jgi:hypothetical protein